MKTKSILPQIIASILVASFAFSFLSFYAVKKAHAEDPMILDKIEAKLQKHYNNENIHINIDLGGSHHELSQVFEMPVKKISLQTISGEIKVTSVKNSNQVKFLIRGRGNLPSLKMNADQSIQLEENLSFGSADVTVELPESFNGGISVYTASGDIEMNELSIQNINAESISGDIHLKKFSSKKANLKTVSGDLDFNQNQAGDTFIDSISGNVELNLPKSDAGFDFDIKTTSGDVDNAAETTTKGTTKIVISTVSGDIEIK